MIISIWSAIDTISHIMGMFPDCVRFMLSVEILAGIISAFWRSFGLSTIFERTSTLRVKRTRHTFLQIGSVEGFDKCEEFLPDREHDQNIVITVVKILVSHNREE